MKKVLLATIILLAFTQISNAFDGERKGFVMGLGVGVSPLASWKTSEHSSNSEELSGGAFDFLTGYAWDNQNMIVLNGQAAFVESDYYSQDITQSFFGISWYHYFKPQHRTFFTVIGAGSYSFEGKTYEEKDRGAILLGGGYEFAKSAQVGLYYSYGKTSDGSENVKHNQLNLIVTCVAY